MSSGLFDCRAATSARKLERILLCGQPNMSCLLFNNLASLVQHNSFNKPRSNCHASQCHNCRHTNEGRVCAWRASCPTSTCVVIVQRLQGCASAVSHSETSNRRMVGQPATHHDCCNLSAICTHACCPHRTYTPSQQKIPCYISAASASDVFLMSFYLSVKDMGKIAYAVRVCQTVSKQTTNSGSM